MLFLHQEMVLELYILPVYGTFSVYSLPLRLPLLQRDTVLVRLTVFISYILLSSYIQGVLK